MIGESLQCVLEPRDLHTRDAFAMSCQARAPQHGCSVGRKGPSINDGLIGCSWAHTGLNAPSLACLSRRRRCAEPAQRPDRLSVRCGCGDRKHNASALCHLLLMRWGKCSEEGTQTCSRGSRSVFGETLAAQFAFEDFLIADCVQACLPRFAALRF